jgi:hypothetical protein
MGPDATEMRTPPELAEFNHGFLRLLRAVPVGRPAFGLESAVLARLQALPAAAVDALARAPVLLAGFRDLPGVAPRSGVAEARPALPALPAHGGAAPAVNGCRVYAAALLTWLWQVNRQHPLAAVLHMGPGPALPEWLGRAGYAEIQQAADIAPGALEARFSGHCRAWPDLVRAASAGDPDLLMTTHMSVVQLALVGPGANADGGAGRPAPGDPGHYNARR